MMRVKLRKTWFASSAAVKPNQLQVIRGKRYRANVYSFPFSLLEILPSNAEIISGGPSGFKGRVGDWRKVQEDFPLVTVTEVPEERDDSPDMGEAPYVDPRHEADVERTSAELATKKINEANGVGPGSDEELKAKAAEFKAQLEAEQSAEVSRDTKPERKRSK